MSCIPIVKQPNSVLRVKAKELPRPEIKKSETKKLIADMIETMRLANGIGIAAPQVGVSLRVLIADDGGKILTLINPKIVKKSWRSAPSEEGCLSVPGVFGIVNRTRAVTVKALNPEDQPVTIKAGGLLAIILQHEIDHLNGILFIDKVKKYTNPPKM